MATVSRVARWLPSLSVLKGSSLTPAAASRGFATSASRSNRQHVRMLLVGSPGSGKGTISDLLRKAYPNITAISAGDLLRKHIRLGDEIGKQADKVIKAGNLMPDEIVMEMIGKEVNQMGDRDWLLDGFPRTQGQATLLDQSLSAQGKPLNLVVNLDVPEEVILGRILDRWLHPSSGRTYNTSYNPPKTPGKDDVTGEPLVQRSDDNEETLRARLKGFYEQTGPMIDHYRLSFDHFSVPDDAGASQALDKIDTALQGASHIQKVFVDITGKESAQIWPKLRRVFQARYGMS